MKKLLIIFLALAALLLREECHGQGTVKYTAGISYGIGAPTYTPTGNVSKKYINLTTLRSYTYSGTAWVLDGHGIDVVSGCSAPNYTPGIGQSNIVINNCTELQNGQGPELYAYSGSAWIFINEKSTAPTYTAGTGIDITGAVISNTGDLSNTNELQTLSSGTNTVTLSNSGGTVTVDTDPTNDITSLSGGTGISISGSGNSRTITNTGDLSTTNELQIISISGDTISLSDGGGSVVVPAGGVTWPLLAPTAEIPVSYSFEDYPQTGIFSPDGGLYINTLNGDGYSNLIAIYAGAGIADPGGTVEMGAGGSTENDGGYFLINAGSSNSGNGGGFDLKAGDSETGSGGNYTVRSGNGDQGGNFSINAGDGISKGGGNFSMAAGNGATGGSFTMSAGNGGTGGVFAMYGGDGIESGGGFGMYGGSATEGDGGYAVISGGSSDDSNGGLVFISGGNAPSSQGGAVLIVGGEGSGGSRAAIEINNILRITPITVSVRDAITGKQIGYTVYCSNATANDGSAGVMQTWNGSIWKNHW